MYVFQENDEELFVSNPRQSSSQTTRNGYSPLHSSDPQLNQQDANSPHSIPVVPIHGASASETSEIEIEIDDMTNSATQMLPKDSNSNNQTASRSTQLQASDNSVRICKVCNIPVSLQAGWNYRSGKPI